MQSGQDQSSVTHQQFSSLYLQVVNAFKNNQFGPDAPFLKKLITIYVDVIKHVLTGNASEGKKRQLIQSLEELKTKSFVHTNGHGISIAAIDLIQKDILMNGHDLKESLNKSPTLSDESFITQLENERAALEPNVRKTPHMVSGRRHINTAKNDAVTSERHVVNSRADYQAGNDDKAISELQCAVDYLQQTPGQERKLNDYRQRLARMKYEKATKLVQSVRQIDINLLQDLLPGIEIENYNVSEIERSKTLNEAVILITDAIKDLELVTVHSHLKNDLLCLYHFNLAKLNQEQNEIHEAIYHFNQALISLNAIPDNETNCINYDIKARKEKIAIEIIKSHMQAAEEDILSNKVDKAMQNYENALNVFDDYLSDKLTFPEYATYKRNLLISSAAVLVEMSDLELKKNDFEWAINYLNDALIITGDALSLSKEYMYQNKEDEKNHTEIQLFLIKLLAELGKVHLQSQKTQQAIQYFTMALKDLGKIPQSNERTALIESCEANLQIANKNMALKSPGQQGLYASKNTNNNDASRPPIIKKSPSTHNTNEVPKPPTIKRSQST